MEYGNGSTNRLVWQSTQNRYHHEEDLLTLDNPNVNISVLGSKIEDGSTILDVGCGEGKLGRLLREKNCKIYGIEIDTDAISFAMSQGYYKDIYNFNIEFSETCPKEFERFKMSEITFDYIAIVDVLEHTINPTKVIELFSEYLNSNGKMLISIPNINNADIVLNLLRGKFNYQEAGILDNTHTKYFTKSSFVEWVKDMNEHCNVAYDCEYLGGIYGLTGYLEHLKQNMPLVYNFIQLNPEYNVIQNLFLLHKKQQGDTFTHLKELLQEKRSDMVQILSDLLENGIDDKNAKIMGGVKLLPNERNILEEKVRVNEQGWEISNQKYEEVLQALEQSRIQCEENYLGWLESNRKYEEALQALKESQEQNNKNLAGWKESDQKYNEVFQELQKCQELCDKNLTGWKECDIKRNETFQALQECKKQCDKNLAGWKECEQKYNEAMTGWKECNKKLQECLSKKSME